MQCSLVLHAYYTVKNDSSLPWILLPFSRILSRRLRFPEILKVFPDRKSLISDIPGFPGSLINIFNSALIKKKIFLTYVLEGSGENICAFPHIWLCTRFHLNFHIDEENFVFFFYYCVSAIISQVTLCQNQR